MPNVVIVDDQATDRQILTRLAGELAADVNAHAFARPGDALAWLREHQPDLILIDYRMPDMDGLAFLDTLTEIPTCAGIPVVVITVVDDSDLRYRALESGATEFLTKPLDLQECQARCRNLLTLRRQQLTISRHVERLTEARRRTGRALRTLSRAHELLVATQSEQDLATGICRIVTEQAGYQGVHVGLWDRNGHLHEVGCIPVASRQDPTALTHSSASAFTDRVRTTGEISTLTDLSTEERDWPCALRGAGFLSAALLPVRIEGLVDGLLAVFSHHADVFDRDEIDLLSQTASSLGYGLAAHRAQRSRDRAQRDCRYLTHFDRLTGLPNRNRLLERLHEWIEAGTTGVEMAALVINLDRFKQVNNTTGHEAGDQLLLQVVRRLQAVTRESDMLARQSGDEFVLLTRGEADTESTHGHGDAERMAQQVIESMQRPLQIAGYDYYIGASIGISPIAPVDAPADADPQSILRRADTAMRQAKTSGGNTWSFYSGELTERHTRRLSLESRLRQAVEREDFALHYQPIVELAGGRTIGVEALLRWPQEDGSLMPPDAFIPLAEETGLMEPLGDWVFRTACAQARAWEDEGIMPYMSVNLSVHQLLRAHLADDLAAVMQEHGINPEHIELEVTESAMMTEPNRTERIVHALHERGVGIALDDFGIGYSSLSRLKHLPITTLKIDKEFVLGLPGDPAEHTIVQSIVQLAGNLRVRAVAEGIETAAQQRALTLMGCHFGQGFHFSAPVPAEQLRAMLVNPGSPPRDRIAGHLKRGSS